MDLWDAGTARGGSQFFGDGDGKVGEVVVGLLVPWKRPFSCVTYTCRRAYSATCNTWK
jgi:hypothetical protein